MAVIKKSQAPAAVAMPKGEVDSFMREVAEVAKGMVKTASGKFIQKGETDNAYLVFKARVTDKVHRTAQQVINASDEEEAIRISLRRTFGDKNGKLSTEQLEQWAVVYMQDGDGYGAQGMAYRAGLIQDNQEELASVKASHEAKESALKAKFEDMLKSGDSLLMAHAKAQIREGLMVK